MAITGDPLPYGLASNRRVIDTFLAHALSQKIITRPVAAEALFARATLRLTG